MQETESMDLKHSDSVNGNDSYIPNSKSTDLIKPSKSGNLDNQPSSGECCKTFFFYSLHAVCMCLCVWESILTKPTTSVD